MEIGDFYDLIHHMVTSGKTYAEISSELEAVGLQKGASAANVRKYCSEKGINPRSNALCNSAIDTVVSSAVCQLGPTYGRRMMTGYLSSQGFHVGETRVGNSLRKVNAPYALDREQRFRNRNVIPYHAAYYGHKLHIDQNEKLVMFGVTHVIAIDGYSSRIVKFSSMPKKNNITIYDEILRPAVLEEGMWDTIRVDHGKEFYLCLHMQQKNADKRRNTARQPFIQSTSTTNLRIERIWPEVNNRVNYPLKAALVQLLDENKIDMDDDLHKFCVSNLTLQLATIGIRRFVNAWNCHTIQGRGIPNVMRGSGIQCPSPLTDQDFPAGPIAADLYRLESGGTLTDPSYFAISPFASIQAQHMCDAEFRCIVPNLDILLDKATNRDYLPYQNALLHLIATTARYRAT